MHASGLARYCGHPSKFPVWQVHSLHLPLCLCRLETSLKKASVYSLFVAQLKPVVEKIMTLILSRPIMIQKGHDYLFNNSLKLYIEVPYTVSFIFYIIYFNTHAPLIPVQLSLALKGFLLLKSYQIPIFGKILVGNM